MRGQRGASGLGPRLGWACPCPHPLPDTRADSGQQASCCGAWGEKWNQELCAQLSCTGTAPRGGRRQGHGENRVTLRVLEGAGAEMEEWAG